MGGSRHYLDQQAFADAGIGVKWQELTHPVYPQCGGGPFKPGQTALDLLFNVGPQACEYFHETPNVRAERLAA
jgi:hypothetical protein